MQKHRSEVSGPSHSLPPSTEWVVSEQIDGWHQPGNTPSYSYYLRRCQKSHTDRLHMLTEWCITDRLRPRAHTHNDTLRTDSLGFPGQASHEGGQSDEKWCWETKRFTFFSCFHLLLFRISVSNFCSWIARLCKANGSSLVWEPELLYTVQKIQKVCEAKTSRASQSIRSIQSSHWLNSGKKDPVKDPVGFDMMRLILHLFFEGISSVSIL